MLQYIQLVYFKIIRSPKTYFYVLLNFLLTSIYFFVQYISSRNIPIEEIGNDLLLYREYKIISYFGLVNYFVTLGILLWFIILLEIIKTFRSNNDTGILLTQVTRSFKRSHFLIGMFIGIFGAFFTVVFLNISMNYLIAMIIFKFSSLALFKMYLVTILYAIIHLLFIIFLLTFIAIVIKQTEYSIITSVILVLLFSMSILLKYSIQNMNLADNLPLFNGLMVFSFIDSYPYLYLVRYVFTVFNEQLAAHTETTIDFFTQFHLIENTFKDFDLGFISATKASNVKFVGTLINSIFITLNLLVMALSYRIFTKMDIMGD